MRSKLIASVIASVMLCGVLPAPGVYAADGAFVEYDCFPALGFEDSSKLTVTADNGGYVYAQNDAEHPAHSGASAIFIEGGTAVRVSAGMDVSGTSRPQDGDEISGSYWFKIMQDKPGDWHCPRISVYMTEDGTRVKLSESAGTVSDADGDEKYNIWTSPRHEWVKLDMISTGEEYRQGCDIICELDCWAGVGLSFMIDDITLGTSSRNVAQTSEFKRYNMYSLLDFEDASQFHTSGELINFYNGGSCVSFKYDDADYPAAEGKGALYCDCSSGRAFSIWGGGVIPSNAEDGENVSGTFRFRLEQPLYNAREYGTWGTWFCPPEIVLKSHSTGDILCRFDPSAFRYDNIEAYTWYTVEIPSAGTAYTAGDMLDFTVQTVQNCGMKFMIDDVCFGVKPESAPTTAPTQTPSVSYEDLSPENAMLYEMDDLNMFSKWAATGSSVEIQQGIVRSGSGALEFTGLGSVWGAPDVVNQKYKPHDGDHIGGSYWLYLKRKPANTTDASLKIEFRCGTDVIAWGKRLDSDLPLNTWIEMPIYTSAANGVDGLINIVIENNGANKCIIDGIRLTKQTPLLEFDRESFDELALHSGLWRSADADTAVGITSSTVYEGSGALEFGAQGTKLEGDVDISNFDWQVSDGEEIAGSFMLYLKAPLADDEGISVGVKCAGEYIAKSLPVPQNTPTGKWVRVVIDPVSGRTVSGSTYLEILNTSGGSFVIDSLKFAPAVDVSEPVFTKNGYRAPYLVSGDTVCSVSVTNNTSETRDIPSAVIVSVYDAGGRLISISPSEPVSTSLAGGGSVTLSVPVTMPELNTGEFYARVFIFDSLQGLKPYTVSRVFDSTGLHYGAAAGKCTVIDADDERIAYIGRWQTDNICTRVSAWHSGYFRIKFTGTSVKLRLGSATDFYVMTDDMEPVSHGGTIGIFDVTPAGGLSEGVHTMTVASSKPNLFGRVLSLEGVILDEDAQILEPDVSDICVEFVGDSITEGDVRNYSWYASEDNGWESVRIAYSGIALTDNIQNYATTLASGRSTIGMSYQYFKTTPDITTRDTQDYDFSGYKPDAVVINLGTNDDGLGVSNDVFKAQYISFVNNIRKIHKDCPIFVIRPFGKYYNGVLSPIYSDTTRQIVNELNAAGDTKVYYIDTASWITQQNASVYLADNVHPNVNGHKYVGDLLAAELIKYIK